MADLEQYILKLGSWHTPATDYPEQELGTFRVHHGHYPRGTYDMYGIDGNIFFRATKPLIVTSLQEKRGRRWCDWMVDDPPHWRAMQIYADHSVGKVLTTGLGLGLYAHALKGNTKVKSITVVERSSEVIQLMTPHLPALPNLIIVQGDFYDFLKTDASGWDTIMIDLWVSGSSLEKMDIFLNRVIPMAIGLRMKNPEASITFHGFYSVSDIPFATREMVDKVLEIKGLLREI